MWYDGAYRATGLDPGTRYTELNRPVPFFKITVSPVDCSHVAPIVAHQNVQVNARYGGGTQPIIQRLSGGHVT